MVSIKKVQASNALLKNSNHFRVAVFVGGTSGIGQATIRAMVETGMSTKIYLVGRKSAEKCTSKFIQDLHTINPKAELIWAEAEVSLLSETRRICNVIKAKESRVDLLFLTAGYTPFSGRRETAEGLEVTQSLQFYSRMLFILLILPLLDNSEAPRVVSVLGGGFESSSVRVDDIELRKAENSGAFKSQFHMATMGTTMFERITDNHPNITIVHTHPGSVMTGNHRRGAEPDTILARCVWPILEPVVGLMSSSKEESGQRHLFNSTSAFFGGNGVRWNGQTNLNSRDTRKNGLFLVNRNCDLTPNSKNVRSLRESSSEKVLEYMNQILKPYLVGSESVL